jgi:hypothetical protein
VTSFSTVSRAHLRRANRLSAAWWGSRRSHGDARSIRGEECARAGERGDAGHLTPRGGAACRSPSAAAPTAAARAALVRPEPVRTGQLSATTQPDEHEHQDHEAGRASRAGSRGDLSDLVPGKVRGLPPHPPWDDGAEPEPVKSAFGVLRIGCAAS